VRVVPKSRLGCTKPWYRVCDKCGPKAATFLFCCAAAISRLCGADPFQAMDEEVQRLVNSANGETPTDYDRKLQELGDWIVQAKPPADVENAARRLLLDTIACAIAGFRKVDVSHLVDGDGDGDSGYGLVGMDQRLGSSELAYAFALAACADEACEGLAFAHGRPGLHAVAAGLGAAFRANASLAELIDAVVAGFEFGGRMGALFRAKPGIHVDGTWGLVASTVAARRMLGGDGAALADAAAAALCQMPASLYLPVAQGSDLRNTYSGHAAAAGMLVAASLAGGMPSAQGAVEAAGGFAFNRDDAAWLGPGEHLILQGYLKPYPSVRHTHYGIEAAREWRRQHGDVRPEDIGSVVLEIYPEAVTYCGNRAPRTAIMGQFSLSYTLAYSLIHGDLTPAAYEPEALTNPSLQALEAAVETIPVPALAEGGQRQARLTVEVGGKLWSSTVDNAPGDSSSPLSDDYLAEKVRTFCQDRVASDRVERLIADLLTGAGTELVRGLLVP